MLSDRVHEKSAQDNLRGMDDGYFVLSALRTALWIAAPVRSPKDVAFSHAAAHNSSVVFIRRTSDADTVDGRARQVGRLRRL